MSLHTDTETAGGLKLRLLGAAAKFDRVGIRVVRIALVVVLTWIGGLKFARYEADSIVPFVANSPFMQFFYHYPAPEYQHHGNKEGQLVPANRAWNEANNTYPFSYGLGSVIVGLGLLIALHGWKPELAALGSFLVILMSCVTLSFLITTPEVWVQPLGDANHGFPYLAGAGRLVVKDTIMLGAAMITMADSAQAYLRRK